MSDKPTYEELEQRVKEFEKEVEKRKRVEDALLASEGYRVLVEGTEDLVTRVDNEGKFIFVNQTSEKIFGLKPEECIGLLAFDFVHFDDREMTKEAFDGWLSGKTKNITFENRQVSKTGEVFDMLWTCTLLYDKSSHVVGINSIARDISKRKQAEEALREREERERLERDRLELILKTAQDGFWLVDASTGLLIEINEASSSMLGYTREELLTRGLTDIDAQWSPEEIGREMQKVKIAGHALFETCHRAKGGQIIDVEVSVNYLPVTDQFFSFIRNITERKQAEEKIKSSLKEKEVLLSEIHHRVKNNIQVITSLLKLQADKIKDKQYANMFQDSQDRIKSMALIHEQLYQTKNFANIDFGEYVKSFANGLFVSYGVDTNKIKLNIDIKDVSIDLQNAVPCGLIINELVSNSLKHAFPQQEEGNIGIVLQSTNEGDFELTVSDDGIGISEDLDIEQTDTMGLHLVKVLAEHQLAGIIDLDRTEGTQFRIKFKKSEYKPRI